MNKTIALALITLGLAAAAQADDRRPRAGGEAGIADLSEPVSAQRLPRAGGDPGAIVIVVGDDDLARRPRAGSGAEVVPVLSETAPILRSPRAGGETGITAAAEYETASAPRLPRAGGNAVELLAVTADSPRRPRAGGATTGAPAFLDTACCDELPIASPEDLSAELEVGLN